MQRPHIPQQYLGMITGSILVILIFAAFLWVDLGAPEHDLKWYAAMVGIVLCLTSLVVGLLSLFVKLRK